MFQLLQVSCAGFDSCHCSFGGSCYESHFWWDRCKYFVFMCTL